VQNLGSGFLISSDGYIVTNEHVVHNAVEIIVTMANGTQHKADIVGTDYFTDVALLKIKESNLPYIKWGDSNDVIIGEWAIAIGNPYGLFSNNAHPTVTVGVISALDRDFQLPQERKVFEDMIQTDASINPGNSGGPLLNSEGLAIGINTMIFSESGGSVGLGFAIPSNKVKEVVEVLKASGTINRNYWIGISVQDVTPSIAVALALNRSQGVVVTDIDPQSPADKAGMKVTDVILKMDKQEILNKETIQQLLNIKDYKVGDTMTFQVYRGGRVFDVKLKLEALSQ
jgi:serine protease Do